MELSPLANSAFADGVELRFGRQPIDTARAAGLEFHDIDKAALEAGASAGVGTMFVAEMPGWGIVCQRPKPRVISVLRMMPAHVAHVTERTARSRAAMPGPIDLGGGMMTRRSKGWLDQGLEPEAGPRIVRDELLDGYAALVASIARRYANRGVALTRLIEAGREGLRHAVDEFDPVYGVPFSTRASWWIKHAIKRTLAGFAPAQDRPVPGRSIADPEVHEHARARREAPAARRARG